MGTVIQASELTVGDLYREYSSLVGPIIRRVTGRRIVRTVETYEVLTTEALDGTRRGEISLRADVSVERLEPMQLDELTESMKYASFGEEFNVVYADQGFWF